MFDPDVELGHGWVLRYLELKAAGRIGAVWPGPGGVYYLAPADAVQPFHQREAISVPKLRDLIAGLERASQIKESAPQAPPKIPPVSAGAPRLLVRKQSA
ncbi:MAG TPA: hypothetical protein VHC90_07300 [Bryobacteraceae bacterium]|nr:hypothetical protein [Bryobacteraceae bacterium]